MQHSPNVGSLSDQNADPRNWKWEDNKSRAAWEPAEQKWQDFGARWYGATQISPVDRNSLSLEPLAHDIRSISSSIFIRESYVTMFDTVWAEAIDAQGSGVIITGQPGTGKTLFLYYLLVRLLQRKQVILFSPDGKGVYLFFNNKVYKGSMEVIAAQGMDVSLPNPISSSDVFIWSLFDIRERKEPAEFLVTNRRFPVQTTSPNPKRYQTWRKEQFPLLTGLPLWIRDELAQGLRYHRRYRSLLNALHKAYKSSSPNSSDPLAVYPGARALLDEHYNEEDTMKPSPEDTSDEHYSEEGAVQPSPEDALDYLLDAAIDRFGFSARDVFGAVFNCERVTQLHQEALGIKYDELKHAVSALSRNEDGGHAISHRILALRPVYQGPFMGVSWNVDFKSDWIARSMIQQLGKLLDIEIREQISFFQNIPDAKGLAGRMLEPLAHRYIANTTDGFWPLINMDSNGADSPHFTLVEDPPVPDNIRFIKIKRNIVGLDAVAGLSACLENNSYYIPQDPNFPLFDAFTIELDRAKKSAILWVLQMTTSRKHGGSALGYRRIREIIAILKDELRGVPPLKKSKTAAGQATPQPLVQVRYLLVVPKDGSEFLQWQFPKGWNRNWKKNDHRGKVYCLKVPLTVFENRTQVPAVAASEMIEPELQEE